MIPLILDTDQTRCYDRRGREISCEGSGQDAAFSPRVAWPTPRFVDQGSTVLDELTALVWTKDAGLTGFPLMWEEAFEYIEEMNRTRMLGYGDWRLPDRQALFSLVSHDHINPSLDSKHPFANVFTGYYWTSTPCARLPGEAWYVHFGGGRVFKGMCHGSYMVWPVRNDGDTDRGLVKEYLSPRFIEEEETVLDRLTGLLWSKDAQGALEPVDWQTALHRVHEMNAGKSSVYGEWRLPNIRELESLVQLDRHSPALTAGHPFAKVRAGYWSSTSSALDPCYAWVLYTEDGAVGVGYKTKPEFFVWPVQRAKDPDRESGH